MFAETAHTRPEINFVQMRDFMHHGWGPVGIRVAEAWREFNDRYFESRLRPVPITLVATSPHGHWLGLTSGMRPGNGHAVCRCHLLQLTYPASGRQLIADRGVLLHEMVHQALVEAGLYPSHDGEPWRNEITRLHGALTGERLWCAYDQVRKVDGKSVRVPRPAPESGMRSIEQAEIARWPRSLGIELGAL